MDNICLEFDAVIVKEDDVFVSLCLDVDVASQGDTIEEAKRMLVEAVEGYLEVSIENNLPFLRPVPEKDNPLIHEKEGVVERFKIKTDLKIHTYA